MGGEAIYWTKDNRFDLNNLTSAGTNNIGGGFWKIGGDDLYFLRVYTHKARMKHWCDRCCRYIEPGETYEGMVVALGDGRLIVFKTHITPSCDEPPDPDYEKYKEVEGSFEFEWKEAA